MKCHNHEIKKTVKLSFPAPLLKKKKRHKALNNKQMTLRSAIWHFAMQRSEKSHDKMLCETNRCIGKAIRSALLLCIS